MVDPISRPTMGDRRGKMKKLAILDDYQNVAMDMADWSLLDGDIEIAVFNDHLSDEDDVAGSLPWFEIVMLMRERTPFPRSLIEKLPKLEHIVSSVILVGNLGRDRRSPLRPITAWYAPARCRPARAGATATAADSAPLPEMLPWVIFNDRATWSKNRRHWASRARF